MNITVKQRIVGTIFIVSLALILIPIFFEKETNTLIPRLADKPPRPAALNPESLLKIEYVFTEVDETPEDFEWAFNLREEADKLESWFFETDAQSADLIQETPIAPMTSEAIPALPKAGLGELSAPAVPQLSSASLADTLPQAERGSWTIQIGAFSDKKNAQILVQKLLQQGFQAYTEKSKHDGLFRVYVAQGVSKETAEDLLSQLSIKAGVKGIVVRFSDQTNG